MNLIELHMLQSFPVNCLNRDQFGSPKSTTFGGVPRARVSSQCWKRAIRLAAREENEMFSGTRSKFFVNSLKSVLLEQGKSEDEADKISQEIAAAAKIKIEKDGKVKNLFYFSAAELKSAVQAYLNADKENASKAAVKELEKVVRDGVDIAFFGRMVAKSNLTLEGAAMFSHAISVNRVDNDLDFFATVDDLKNQDSDPETKSTGSAYIDDLEFNTACYYRYIALNLDLLADSSHLGILSQEERKNAVRTFLRACVMAVPAARRNSMLANTLPGFILGVSRKGAPLSLANAFEKPVGGISLLEKSQKNLCEHWESLKKLYSIPVDYEANLPEKTLDALIGELVDHVK